MNSGVITDRSGVVLLDSTDGRVYAEDAEVRKATLHLLGDREGYIAAPLLSEYADALVGYDSVSYTHLDVYKRQARERATLVVQGRHDPCIVHRAVPVLSRIHI